MRIFISTLLAATLILPPVHPRSPAVPLIAAGAVVTVVGATGAAICHYKRKKIVSKLIQRKKIRTINGYQLLCMLSTLFGISLCSLGAIVNGTAHTTEKPPSHTNDTRTLSLPMRPAPPVPTPVIITPPPAPAPSPEPAPPTPKNSTPAPAATAVQHTPKPLTAPIKTPPASAVPPPPAHDNDPAPDSAPVSDTEHVMQNAPVTDTSPTKNAVHSSPTSTLSAHPPCPDSVSSDANPCIASLKTPTSACKAGSPHLSTDRNPLPPPAAPKTVRTKVHFAKPKEEETTPATTPVPESVQRITPNYEDDPTGVLAKRRDDLAAQKQELQKIADSWDVHKLTQPNGLQKYESLLRQIHDMKALIERCNEQIKLIKDNPPSPSDCPTPTTDELISSLDTYITTSTQQINAYSRVRPTSPVPLRSFDSPQPPNTPPPTCPPGAPTVVKTHPVFGDQRFAPLAPAVEEPPA